MPKQIPYNFIYLQRKDWALKDPVLEAWFNEFVWKCIEFVLQPAGSKAPGLDPFPRAAPDPKTVATLQKILVHNEMHGIGRAAYAAELPLLFDAPFLRQIELDYQRTEVLIQELHWTISPRLDNRAVAIRGAAARKFYPFLCGDEKFVPRLIPELTVWVPTLASREELISLLVGAGYELADQNESYLLRKQTGELSHAIRLRGMLWEASKNWSTDMERSSWGRAQRTSAGVMALDLTDQFILGCRHFTIDTLVGSAIGLLDLLLLLSMPGQAIDWVRVQEVKNTFAKPDWLWAALTAVLFYEKKTGRKLNMPDWVREDVGFFSQSFWSGFVESRLCWASPDSKSIDFTRAFVKLTKGN